MSGQSKILMPPMRAATPAASKPATTRCTKGAHQRARRLADRTPYYRRFRVEWPNYCTCLARLKPDGRTVMNFVTIENLATATAARLPPPHRGVVQLRLHAASRFSHASAGGAKPDLDRHCPKDPENAEIKYGRRSAHPRPRRPGVDYPAWLGRPQSGALALSGKKAEERSMR